MTSTASHSATPPHGRPAHGTARAGRSASAAPDPAAADEGRLPVGPAGASDGLGGPGRIHGFDGFDGFGAPGGPCGPVGPWSVRSVPAGRGRRAALEVYEHGELVDVVVASRLGRGLLRGARAWAGAASGSRSGPGGRRSVRHGLAWGRLPDGGAAPAVGFTRGGLLRLPGRHSPVVTAGEVVTVAGEFWLAWAEGVLDGVLVEAPGGAGPERSPLVRVRTARDARTVPAESEGAR
ncbi:hypothetical protein ACFVFS_27770 [Kitasatospora sp. NPDC057692]|uniref:hypothetical protein n=1 Tax=Kitasatospora sp. NPDC057692 TaxID=3346215 RepID=UPI003693581D